MIAGTGCSPDSAAMGWLLLMWRNALKLAALYVRRPIFWSFVSGKNLPISDMIATVGVPNDVLGNYKRCRKKIYMVSCNSRTLKPGNNWKMVLQIVNLIKGRCWERMSYHKSHIVKYSQLCLILFGLGLLLYVLQKNRGYSSSYDSTYHHWFTGPLGAQQCTSKKESVYKI